RASEIVNNLLNFSRTSAAEFAEVDVNRVIVDTLSLLEHQFKTGRIRVQDELAAHLPPIQGNAGRLQQVFLNLFLNAKDAMPDGAVISGRMTDAPTQAQGCILIIDDEAEIRESLQTLLEFEGYEVEAAANGAQGLSKLGDRPFDLVLLDLALPDRNGLELLPEIRAIDPQISVIMITAYGTVEDAVRA